MGGNGRLRRVVLLRASGGAQGRTNAWSRDVDDLWGDHWSVARYGRECAGIFGSSVDRRSKASRHAVSVSPTRAGAA